MNPNLKSLADLLIGIAVRELRNANAGIEKAGPVTRPGDFKSTNIRSVGRDEQYTTRDPQRVQRGT